MPKRRKRVAGLGNRKIFNIKGRSYVRQKVDGIQICKKNKYKSLNLNSNPPIKRNENTFTQMQGQHIGKNLRNLQVYAWNYDHIHQCYYLYLPYSVKPSTVLI